VHAAEHHAGLQGHARGRREGDRDADWIDPASPYHKDVIAQDKKFVFFCAGGWRSALAAQTAHRMGMKPVAHIRGGFSEWKKSGKPIEAPEEKPKG
jgi:rhodanese-related sulfurtransferase